MEHETQVAIDAFKAWVRARERYQESLSTGRNYPMRLRIFEQMDARLSLAVVKIPDPDMAEYVLITDEYETRVELAKAGP